MYVIQDEADPVQIIAFLPVKVFCGPTSRKSMCYPECRPFCFDRSVTPKSGLLLSRYNRMMSWMLYLVVACIIVSACSSREEVDQRLKVTGSPAAVVGFPRHRDAHRFKIEGCCTFQLPPATKAVRLPSIDSTVYSLLGPGFKLDVVFGPYDAAPAGGGYRFGGERRIDGMRLRKFHWEDGLRNPADGKFLWLADVGGGLIEGVNHNPWGLRIKGHCKSPVTCREATALVQTIRF